MKFLVGLLTFFLISCSGNKPIELAAIELENINGETVNLGESAGKDFLVLIFMSPDCPLCVNYTRTLNDLNTKFSDKGVKFLTVYPGTFYQKDEILKFTDQYDFVIAGILDPDNKLTKMVRAQVTPEAILISNSGETLYRGAIDNWVYETGKKRSVITHPFLENAIHRVLKGESPDPAYSEPIGCFIEI